MESAQPQRKDTGRKQPKNDTPQKERGTGDVAMQPPAAPRVQNASDSHPQQRDCPDKGPCAWRDCKDVCREPQTQWQAPPEERGRGPSRPVVLRSAGGVHGLKTRDSFRPNRPRARFEPEGTVATHGNRTRNSRPPWAAGRIRNPCIHKCGCMRRPASSRCASRRSRGRRVRMSQSARPSELRRRASHRPFRQGRSCAFSSRRRADPVVSSDDAG